MAFKCPPEKYSVSCCIRGVGERCVKGGDEEAVPMCYLVLVNPNGCRTQGTKKKIESTWDGSLLAL